MTKYAWVLAGEIRRVLEADEAPAALPAEKGAWLPLDEEGGPFGDYYDVTETVSVEDGRVRRVISGEPKSVDKLKTLKRIAIRAACEASVAGGYPVTSGPMAGHTLQVRNAEDRTNWLMARDEYAAAIDAGLGASLGAVFRTTANVNFTLSFNDGLAVIRGISAWGLARYQNQWALTDAVNAAETSEDALAVDENSGWD